ncbi:iron complex transport system substrate-binding protein [Evansella caseinilytica]|uniref:Iron complex transport system substrate-binding protein n=1 Tax=Evansella caseinilytica TaxID=1503961 RepID=A0A1H3QE88_9BACI|nr:siderophore ABC transporter substrate-binding protein [Evansella caseinilytica]SDZ11716.1 iron complex transport system substrate-binding protein [Evansella caseinilytica]
MKKIMSMLMLVLLLSVFAVACGDGEADGAEDASTEPTQDTTGDEGTDDQDTNDGEAAGEITVTHELGETTVPANPEKVVVFDYGTLDTLDKLGVDVTAVPQDNLPPYLEKYADAAYTNAGTLFEPDFETIYGLSPDLIIISGRTSEAYDELSEIAPTIYMGVDTADYIESFKNNVTTIAEIFNKQAEAATELTAIDEALVALNDKVASLDGNGLVILTSDGDISAFGPGSRFDIVHNEFGITPADENIELANHGQNISFEYIVEKDPDYLFVMDRGAITGAEQSAEALLDNDLVAGTKASQNDHIVYLDAYAWYVSGGGLSSVVQMINDISEGIE